MKRAFVACMAILTAAYCAAQSSAADGLGRIADFMVENQEGVDGISFGISFDTLKPLRSGTVEAVFSGDQFHGVFGGGIVMKSSSTYYLGGSELESVFYVLYSNVRVPDHVEVGDKVTVSQDIGTMANEELPFNAGKDVKIVVFTVGDFYVHVLALAGGRGAGTLPGVDDVFLYPGMWLMETGTLDYLSFFPIEDVDDLVAFPIEGPKPSGTSFNYDLAFTNRLWVDTLSGFKAIGEDSVLKRFIGFLAQSTRNPRLNTMTNSALVTTGSGETIVFVISDSMMAYHSEETAPSSKTQYFLRSFGCFMSEDGSVHSVYGIMDFMIRKIDDVFD